MELTAVSVILRLKKLFADSSDLKLQALSSVDHNLTMVLTAVFLYILLAFHIYSCPLKNHMDSVKSWNLKDKMVMPTYR